MSMAMEGRLADAALGRAKAERIRRAHPRPAAAAYGGPGAGAAAGPTAADARSRHAEPEPEPGGRTQQLLRPQPQQQPQQRRVDPAARKRQVRTELHKALSAGLLDEAEPHPSSAGMPELAARDDSAGDRALRRAHTATHSPLAGLVQDGRDLAFHIADDIPASRRLSLRAALESRGWRVEYNIVAAKRLRQRGVVVLPTEAVHTRGTRVVALEEAGVHVASIEQLLQLLKHPAVYTRTEEPPLSPSEFTCSPTRTRTSDSQSFGRHSSRTNSAASDVDASRASAALLEPLASSSQTQSSSSSSIARGWPAWVLDVSDTPSVDALSPDAAERMQAVQAAHKEKAIVNARQSRLREAVVRGQMRAVKAALRDHPDDVHGKDERGRSPFWLAVLAGRAEMVEVLADAGADIEEEAADGATALFAACHAGNQLVTQTLLELGCNPEKLTVRPAPAYSTCLHKFATSQGGLTEANGWGCCCCCCWCCCCWCCFVMHSGACSERSRVMSMVAVQRCSSRQSADTMAVLKPCCIMELQLLTSPRRVVSLRSLSRAREGISR